MNLFGYIGFRFVISRFIFNQLYIFEIFEGFFSLSFWIYWIENYWDFILGKFLTGRKFLLGFLFGFIVRLNDELKRFWMVVRFIRIIVNILVLGDGSVKGIGKQWIERAKLERNWSILYRKVRDLRQYGNFITKEKFYFKETLRKDFISWISWKAIIYKLLLM